MTRFKVAFEAFVHEQRIAIVEAGIKKEARQIVEDCSFEDSLLVDMEERIGGNPRCRGGEGMRTNNCLLCGRFCRDDEFRFDPREDPIGFICDECEDGDCPGCGEGLSACTYGVSDMNSRIAASKSKEVTACPRE